MSFIRLGRLPGLHVLSGHTFLRESPSYDHLLEADCEIVSVVSDGAVLHEFKVPLADFASYPLGSLFGEFPGRTVANPARRASRRTIQFDPIGTEFWDFERRAKVRRKGRGDPLEVPLPRGQTVMLDRETISLRLGIAHLEQFRFLCAGASLLLDSLSLLSSADERTLTDLVVDPHATGFENDRTLVITPLRGFQSATASLQIASHLGAPAIANYLTSMFVRIRKQIAETTVAMPGGAPFTDPSDYTVMSELLDIELDDGSRELVEFCDRIVADHRKPGFDELVIRVRRSRGDDQITLLENIKSEEERRRERVSSSTRIVRLPSSSVRKMRLASLHSDFVKMFPGFIPVRVRIDYEDRPSSKPRLTSKFRTQTVPLSTGSVGPRGGKEDAPKLESGPVRTEPFERPALAGRFLAESDEPGLEAVMVDLEGLPRHMRGFLDASYHLDDRTARELLPVPAPGFGEEVLFRLPTEWGGLSRSGADGVPRLIAAFPLRFDHTVIWAIEILRRRAGDIFAMGLCAQIEPDDAMRFLGRLMRAVSDRSGRKRGKEIHGTWPRADYDDVRIDTIIHGDHWWDARTLSQVIRARSTHLLAPKKTF